MEDASMDNPNCCTPPNPHGCAGPACEWYGDGEPARFVEHVPDGGPLEAARPVPTAADWAALREDCAAIGRDITAAVAAMEPALRAFAAALAPAHEELVRLIGGDFPGERRRKHRASARARLSTQIRFAEAHLNLLGTPFQRSPWKRGVVRKWRYVEWLRERAGARHPIFTRYTDGTGIYHNDGRR
jgi:hypothetical protein